MGQLGLLSFFGGILTQILLKTNLDLKDSHKKFSGQKESKCIALNLLRDSH